MMTPLLTGTLYFFVFMSTTLCAYLSQDTMNGKLVYKRFCFFISYILHWIVLAFTRIGTDYTEYCRIIEEVSITNVVGRPEILFNTLCLVLKYVLKSPHLVIFVIKTLTLFIFYKSFWMCRNKAELWLAILAFNLLIYLKGFYLLSMQLSAAILLFSFVYLVNNQFVKAFFIMLLACYVHSSSFIFVPVYIIYLWSGGSRKKISWTKIILLIMACIFVLACFPFLVDFLTTNFSALKQYRIYLTPSNNGGTGVMQYVFFGLLLYFVVMEYKNESRVNIKNLAIVFYLSAFLCAILGYRVTILSRISYSFISLYALIIPIYIFSRRVKKLDCGDHGCFLFTYKSDCVLWFLFLCMLTLPSVIGNLNPESTSEIYSYSWAWPI